MRTRASVIAVAVIAIVVSLVASPLAGGAFLAIGMVGVIGFEVTRPNGMLSAAEQARHPHGGQRHVVVVADTALTGETVAEAIVDAAGPGAHVDVLAPVLVSRAHYVMSDHDAETREAQRRLETSLQWAADHGFDAHGEVGDDEPATAMADELRDFGADAVIIVTDSARKTSWAEARELERARAELEVPVVHVEV